MKGKRPKGVFERHKSTGSLAFSFLKCLDATKLLLTILYSYRDDLTENMDKTTTDCSGHSLSTTVLFRTKFTQTVMFNLLAKWLLGSNLSQLQLSLSLSLICCFVFHYNENSFSNTLNARTLIQAWATCGIESGAEFSGFNAPKEIQNRKYRGTKSI